MTTEHERYREWYRAEEADNREHAIDEALALAWDDEALYCDECRRGEHDIVGALRTLAVALEEERELAGELAEVTPPEDEVEKLRALAEAVAGYIPNVEDGASFDAVVDAHRALGDGA